MGQIDEPTGPPLELLELASYVWSITSDSTHAVLRLFFRKKDEKASPAIHWSKLVCGYSRKFLTLEGEMRE